MTEINKMQDTKEPAPVVVPIEERPLAERVKIADTFNPFNGVAAGWLIDAKDTVNNWCVTEVLKTDGNEVKLNYDGWSSKYDDVILLIVTL